MVESSGTRDRQSLSYVFEIGLTRIREQHELWDGIDLKIGVLVGFIGVILAVLVGRGETYRFLVPATLGLGICGIFLAKAYSPKKFKMAVKYEELIEWSNESKKDVQLHFIEGILRAMQHNQEILTKKARFLTWSIYMLVGTFLWLCIAIGFNLLFLS